MDAAHGDYLCFVDSDDAVEPQLAETAVRAAQRYDAQIVFYANMNDRYNDEGTLLDSAQQSSVAFVAETAKEFKRHFLELSHGQYVCPPWNKLFLTSFVKQVGIRFPEALPVVRTPHSTSPCMWLRNGWLPLMSRCIDTRCVRAAP